MVFVMVVKQFQFVHRIVLFVIIMVIVKFLLKILEIVQLIALVADFVVIIFVMD